MAMHVPGRTDNQIKNRFNSNLKKRLEDQVFLKQLMDFKLPKLSEEQSKDEQSKDMHVEPSCDSVSPGIASAKFSESLKLNAINDSSNLLIAITW